MCKSGRITTTHYYAFTCSDDSTRTDGPRIFPTIAEVLDAHGGYMGDCGLVKVRVAIDEVPLSEEDRAELRRLRTTR